MKKFIGIIAAGAGIVCLLGAVAPFQPDQILTAASLNAALANAGITAGTIDGATIGATAPSTGNFTDLTSTSLSVAGSLTSTIATGTPPLVVNSSTNVPNLNASSLNGATFIAPGPIGSGTASTGAFTTLSASSTVSGAGFTAYLASPPAIGGTSPAAGKFTSLTTTNFISTSAPNTQVGATYSVVDADTSIIANRAGTVTLTLPTASSYTGRILVVRTIQAQTVVSATSNVIPLIGGSAGTAILSNTAGKWAMLQSDGSNWQIMMGN